MSLNFLNKITSSVSSQSKGNDVPMSEASSNANDKNDVKDVTESIGKMTLSGKKKFVHGNNVIMIRGTHKGYYGYVNPDEFQPARFEIVIEEDTYIPVKTYGDINIGQEIQTEFGKSKIINKIPRLIEIMTSDKKTLRFPESDMMRIVSYTEGSNIKIGRLNNVKEESGMLNCDITPINIGSISDEESGVKMVGKMIKSGKISFDESSMKEKCDVMNVKFPEYWVVMNKSLTEGDVNYQGVVGKFIRVIPEQYLIRHKKIIFVMPSNIKPRVGNKKTKGALVDIVKGSFKGKVGTIIKKYEPKLTVYIEAAGKRVSEHYVKEGDQFVLAPITPRDVFYMDLKLKNGNDFEVKDVLTNGNFVGVERAKHFQTKEISPEEVMMYHPGFAISGGKDMMAVDDSYTSDETEFISDSQEEDVEDSYDEDEVSSSYEYEESEEVGEDDSYGFSYKDTERVSYQPKGLTSEEETVKTKINKIIKNYGVNETEINIYGLIETVMEVIKKLKSKLGESVEMKDTWVSSDEKYIIGCVVFYEMIKSGMEYLFADNFNDIVGSYITNLANLKYMVPNDIKNTILLKGGWSSAIKVDDTLIKSLKRSKDYNSLYREMFKNCERYLSTIMEIPDIEKVSRVLSQEKLIPVGVHKTKRQRDMEEEEPYTKKFAYVSDVIKGDIPETATKILWDPSYENVLERFRNRLLEKINSSGSNKSTKIVYEYVLNNFEQGPFEMKRMEEILSKDKHLKIDKVKYDTLKMVWNELLNYLKRQSELNEERRRQKIAKKQEKMESEMSRRKVAMELTGNMQSLGLDPDEDEETVMSVQKKQRKYK